jgi:hypothetical protein
MTKAKRRENEADIRWVSLLDPERYVTTRASCKYQADIF